MFSYFRSNTQERFFDVCLNSVINAAWSVLAVEIPQTMKTSSWQILSCLVHLYQPNIRPKVTFESLTLKQRPCYGLEEVLISYQGLSVPFLQPESLYVSFCSDLKTTHFCCMCAALSQPHLCAAVSPFSAWANMQLWPVLACLCAPAFSLSNLHTFTSFPFNPSSSAQNTCIHGCAL